MNDSARKNTLEQWDGVLDQPLLLNDQEIKFLSIPSSQSSDSRKIVPLWKFESARWKVKYN